jgi:hypothetical protein
LTPRSDSASPVVLFFFFCLVPLQSPDLIDTMFRFPPIAPHHPKPRPLIPMVRSALPPHLHKQLARIEPGAARPIALRDSTSVTYGPMSFNSPRASLQICRNRTTRAKEACDDDMCDDYVRVERQCVRRRRAHGMLACARRVCVERQCVE